DHSHDKGKRHHGSKSKQKKRNSSANRSGRNETPETLPAPHAQTIVPPPKLVARTGTPFLTIKPSSRGVGIYDVAILGQIVLGQEHLALINAGYSYGIKCRLWEIDEPDNANDLVYAWGSQTIIDSNYLKQVGRIFAFGEVLKRADLNRDQRECGLWCSGN